jgi:multiple sugar transport system substrate-binding protein
MLTKQSALKAGLSTVAVAAALSFGALMSAAEAANLKMMFQGDPYEIDAISAAAKKFEAANPGTTVELIHTPHDSYPEKVGAAVAAARWAHVDDVARQSWRNACRFFRIDA